MSGAPERMSLDSHSQDVSRRRLRTSLIAIVLIAAAVGGVVGLIGNRSAGLIAAVVVAAPLLYISVWYARRQQWLEGSDLVVRTWGTRRIDLGSVPRLQLFVTEVGNARTIGLLIRPEHGSGVKIDLGRYAGTDRRELDVFELRRLADAVAPNKRADGPIFSDLLVGQLRSIAKGDPDELRPLYRLAAAAPSGKVAQGYSTEAIGRFVKTLD